MIDTARILLGYRCNLSCSYCCNEIPEVREKFISICMGDITQAKLRQYHTVCISGGEPLLYPVRLADILERSVRAGCFTVLYTNGILLTQRRVKDLPNLDAIKVGLHNPETFRTLIPRCLEATKNSGISLRFQVEDIYRNLDIIGYYRIQGAIFRYWKRNECERDNEDRYVVEEAV